MLVGRAELLPKRWTGPAGKTNFPFQDANQCGVEGPKLFQSKVPSNNSFFDIENDGCGNADGRSTHRLFGHFTSFCISMYLLTASRAAKFVSSAR